MVEEIRELYEYDRWANRRLVAAATELSQEELHRDLGSSFPTVFATLGHIMKAEWVWLERWEGRSPLGMAPTVEGTDWEALTAEWAGLEARQRSFVERLTGDDLVRTIEYRSTRGDPFAAPLWQLMRHVANHSTYHRGQVVTLLRQLGRGAPGTDLVLFYRERAADTAA